MEPDIVFVKEVKAAEAFNVYEEVEVVMKKTVKRSSVHKLGSFANRAGVTRIQSHENQPFTAVTKDERSWKKAPREEYDDRNHFCQRIESQPFQKLAKKTSHVRRHDGRKHFDVGYQSQTFREVADEKRKKYGRRKFYGERHFDAIHQARRYERKRSPRNHLQGCQDSFKRLPYHGHSVQKPRSYKKNNPHLTYSEY